MTASLYCTLFAMAAVVDSATLPAAVRLPPGRTCRHAYPLLQDLPHPIHLEERHRVVKRAAEHQMRIKVIYHQSVEDLDPVRKEVVTEKVVAEAVNYWSSILKVRRNEASILMQHKCADNQYFLSAGDPHQYCKNKCVLTKCGEVVVPEEHLQACRTCNSDGLDCKTVTQAGHGVTQADFVLYVSAIQTSQCGESIGSDEAETIAYAAHCQQEAALDRPIAGHTNICPKTIGNSAKEVASLTSTVKHELLHALGFSSSLFAFFRDENGQPRTGREEDGKPPINDALQIRQWGESTIKKVNRRYRVRKGVVMRSFHLLVTPNVVREVRAHFNCSLLEGAELEDQGGDGTALTHWEKRLFQNEAMTGTVHTQNPIYSRLTLALLEDSGWYMPDYDLADDLAWGRGMGCDFALLSCKELMDREGEPRVNGRLPFCSTLMQSSKVTSCTFDRASVGTCNLVQYDDELPEIYQNFDRIEGVAQKDIAKVGSSVALADFCPYVQEFIWKSRDNGRDKSRGTNCIEDANQPDTAGNFALERYRKGSKCFNQGSQWEQKSCHMLKQWQRYGAGCYQYKCDAKDGSLKILLKDNVTLTCAAEGKVLNVSLMLGEWLHQGTLVCPACEEICGPEVCGAKNWNELQVKDADECNHKQMESLNSRCRFVDNEATLGFFKTFGLDFLALK